MEHDETHGSETVQHPRERKKSVRSQNQIPILLVGNKADLVQEKSTIEIEGVQPKEIELLEQQARKHNFVGCVSLAAKTTDGGVHAAMQSLVR